MADEETTAEPTSEGKGSLVRKLGLALGIVMISAILGLVTFKFALAPLFASSENETPPAELIPASAVTVAFDETFVNCIMPEEDMPMSQFVYQVTLECANPETAALVEANRARFNAAINDLHQFRKREDLTKQSVKSEIERQVLETANNTLLRLQLQPDANIRITDVFHGKWAIADQ